MNYRTVHIGTQMITLIQSDTRGHWFVSVKDLSQMLGYTQIRYRAFKDLTSRKLVGVTYVKVSELSRLLKTSTTYERKVIIESFLLCVKATSSLERVTTTDPREGNRGGDARMSKPDGRLSDSKIAPDSSSEQVPLAIHDPLIEKYLKEIGEREQAIAARRKELSSKAKKGNLESKLDTLMAEIKSIREQLVGLN